MVVIGDGLIAKSFMDSGIKDEKVLIFASGVSYSSETDIKEFNRERDLLLDMISRYNDYKIIYFSSVLTNISNTPYYNHKSDMERLIEDCGCDYIIIRLPQVVGHGGNKSTLLKHLCDKVKTKSELVVDVNSYRALIDVRDVTDIINFITPKTSRTKLTISHIEKLKTVDILMLIRKALGVDFIYNVKLSDGIFDNWGCDNSIEVDGAIEHLKIQKTRYTDNLIKKYVSQ